MTTYSNGSKVYSKAKQGKAGTSVSISSTSVTYQISNSGTTTPTGTWQSTVQSTTVGQFLWTRTIVNYSDGSSTTSYAVAAHGATGPQGDPGVSITNVTSTNNTADGGTSVVTVTLSDGTTKTFNVKNGNKGSSSQWYYGTACTHTSGTATPATGISSAIVGDMYLNNNTYSVYRCTTAGASGTAVWTYAGNLVDGVIDDVQIGGTNLLKNTGTFNNVYPTPTSSGIIVLKTDEEQPYISITPTSVGWTNIFFRPLVPFDIIDGKEITVSADVRLVGTISSPASSDFYMTLQAFKNVSDTGRVGNKDHNYSSSVLTKDKWVRLSYTININKSNWSVTTNYSVNDFNYFSLALYNHTTAQIDFRNAKVEVGNIATEWSPAPEDALGSSQRIYKRTNSATAPAAPTSIITDTTDQGTTGNWTLMHMPRVAASNTDYKYLWTCEQKISLGGYFLGTTAVVADNGTTVIDGGDIQTGTVSANRLNVNDIISRGSIIVSGSNISELNNNSGYQTASQVTASATSIAKSQCPFVIQSNASANDTWTGTCSELSSLVDGQVIDFWKIFNWANSGYTNTTNYWSQNGCALNLTLNDGTTTGAIPVFYTGNTRLTSHYQGGSLIQMVYKENYLYPGYAESHRVAKGWYCKANYNSDNVYSRSITNGLYTGLNGVTSYALHMKDENGRWTSIVNQYSNSSTGKTVYTGKLKPDEVLYASTWYTNGRISTNNTSVTGDFWASNVFDFRYSSNGVTTSSGLTTRKPVYLVGTLDSDGYFYLDSSAWWTQTEPTTDDGKVYIYLGTAYSVYQVCLVDRKPMYRYIGGKFVAFNETVIDGGHIITGTVDAAAVNASSGTFNTANIPNLDAAKITSGSILADRIKANVISAVNDGTGTINADKINTSQITIGQSQVTNLTTDLSNKASIEAEYSVSIRVSAINYSTPSATLIATPYNKGTVTTGSFNWYKNTTSTAHGGTVSTTTNTNDTLTVTDLDASYIAVLQ